MVVPLAVAVRPVGAPGAVLAVLVVALATSEVEARPVGVDGRDAVVERVVSAASPECS